MSGFGFRGFRGLGFRISGLGLSCRIQDCVATEARCPSSTLLPIFFLGSLIKTE